ncbi:118_t:CDS:1 [Scutellospora calospora]|uniref:118_t:CDS:1 n=1 Tax=Scutellospora calospora TaxID=85575 RepID=A0ACA9LIY6_9GLOM|nr:118_t:CDS:1 [Scutellospora calospora]
MSAKTHKTRKQRGSSKYIPSDNESENVSSFETLNRSLKGQNYIKAIGNCSSDEYAKKNNGWSHSSKGHSRSSDRKNTAKCIIHSIHRKKPRRKSRKNTVVVVGASESNEPKKMIIPKIVVRNPTHKVVKILKKTNTTSEGHLAPPVPKKRKKRNNNKVITDKYTAEVKDALLASFPLPSSSIPRIFNKNINIIGAINIQSFGVKKISNNAIMRIIVDILQRYDIVFCQEIHVPEGKEGIIQQLADLVSTPTTPYSFVLSRPIGKNSYQERYLYLYRQNEWKVLEDYVIDNEDKDKFIREPYVVRFQHLRKPNMKVTLVGCHTQPENAFYEIKALVTDVFINVRKKLKKDIIQENGKTIGLYTLLRRYLCCCFEHLQDTNEISEENTLFVGDNEPIILMGDFNASGSYLNKKELSELDGILHKNNLVWGIQHSSDTTVAAGYAAYDRFVFEEVNKRRWIGHTRVWRFDESWINEKFDPILVKNVAKRITDHYPIEFELRI